MNLVQILNIRDGKTLSCDNDDCYNCDGCIYFEGGNGSLKPDVQINLEYRQIKAMCMDISPRPHKIGDKVDDTSLENPVIIDGRIVEGK